MPLTWVKNLFCTNHKGSRQATRLPIAEMLEDRTLLTATGMLQQAYGQLPLSFEVNEGQTASQVRFLSHGSGSTLFLTEGSAVLSLTSVSPSSVARSPLQNPMNTTDNGPSKTVGVAIAMNLVGANPIATVVGLDKQAGITNYFIGNDPSQWHTDVANYGKVEYKNVYAGINLVYYGNQQQLEYDFVVAPGANPNNIQLDFQGANSISLDAQGDLVLHTAIGDVLQHAPVMYQEIGGMRRTVPGNFVLGAQGRVSFQVGAYDRSLPLTIDPVLSYSTYLGGNGNDESASGIAVNSSGDAYVTGFTNSTNFPTTTGAFQTSYGGGNIDAFVTELNSTGTTLLYSDYLGGNSTDRGYAIAVDAAGDAFVAGFSSSANFPSTAGAYQTGSTGSNAFVTKLNPSGTALVYSTFLGGDGYAVGDGIAVDTSGNVYVMGTASTNFPTTAGAYQTTYAGGNDVFVTKLNAAGSALLYSTYLGGSAQEDGRGIAVDGSGDAYVTGDTYSDNFPTTAGAFRTSFGGGTDGFAAELNATGSALVYSTFLPGNQYDQGSGIAVDNSGDAYVAGYTESSNFPTTAGALQTTFGGSYDAFVTKLNAAGTAAVYSTFLGGSNYDQGEGIAVDGSGNAYVGGWSASANFPLTSDAFQSTLVGGAPAAFVAKLNSSGSALIYSSFLGGNNSSTGYAIAVDSAGSAYLAGSTFSTNFPTTSGAFQTSLSTSPDAFVARFEIGPPLITAVVINQNISALYDAAGQPTTGVQRSMVDDIVYTFSEPVSILGPANDPNVFSVAVSPGWTGTVPTLSWAAVAGSNDTEWAVSFSGNGVTGGSIANGAYTITVTDPASITAESDGQALTFATDGIGGATQSFFRLFGDINGDGIVNAADNPYFKQALTIYNAAFDYSQDGFVNASDNVSFKSDLTVNFSGFTPTI
jgi:Beta-propeller repeat